MLSTCHKVLKLYTINNINKYVYILTYITEFTEKFYWKMESNKWLPGLLPINRLSNLISINILEKDFMPLHFILMLNQLKNNNFGWDLILNLSIFIINGCQFLRLYKQKWQMSSSYRYLSLPPGQHLFLASFWNGDHSRPRAMASPQILDEVTEATNIDHKHSKPAVTTSCSCSTLKILSASIKSKR